MSGKKRKFDVVVIGGAGHVGLPLSIALADKGQRVLVYDINETTLETIDRGEMPFMERGADELLVKVLANGNMKTSSDRSRIGEAEAVIITIGTPIDEFLHPTLKVVQQCIEDLLPYMDDGQLIIMRSTVYPGVTAWVAEFLQSRNMAAAIAFCPERIVQGYGIEELTTIPQIVAGMDEAATERAAALFGTIAPSIVRMTPMEAECAKLFSNAYRYIQFAVANQFYMICESAGVDYYRVLEGLTQDYPRAKGIPKAGLAAGPCLFKDTMQLSAFFKNQFGIGHAAMLVNEGLPAFMIETMEKLAQTQGRKIERVGILGMAFKADNDDTRASLSYKVKKLVRFRGYEVLTTDPYVRGDESLLPLQDVIDQSDTILLCAPHSDYKDLDVGDKLVLDIWNFWPQGGSMSDVSTARTDDAIRAAQEC